MSTDEKVAKELVETLKDGRNGFSAAAEKLRDSDRPDLADAMQKYADQRAVFAREIVEMGHEYGDDVDEGGSFAAALHRGWLSMKDAVSGDDAGGVLDAAVSGEEHAESEYRKALDADLSDGFRTVVARQHEAVVQTQTELKSLPRD